jgi:hypothetical protein
MNLPAAALAAQRANAAYIEDPKQSKAAFVALGDVWVAGFMNSSHQAVMSVDSSGSTFLSISGTRASNRPEDIFDDVSLDSVTVKGGKVTSGVYEGMAAMWKWALQTAPTDAVFNVCGHSLGGARTHLTPLFILAKQIGALHSFESPKFCDAEFYSTYEAELAGMVCVLNGRDAWAAWPWVSEIWTARPNVDHMWLKDDYYEYAIIPASEWPGGLNVADHSMDVVEKRMLGVLGLAK